MYDINTIFYFPETANDYADAVRDNKISPKTISFVPGENAIYKGGQRYGGMDSTELNNTILELIQQNQFNLLPATTTRLGGIKVGNYLSMDANDKLNVDFNGVKNDLVTGGYFNYDDSWITNRFTELSGNIDTAIRNINTLSDNLNTRILNGVRSILEEYEWIKLNFGDVLDSIFHSAGWSDALDAYVSTAGLITSSDTTWTKVVQGWDNLSATVTQINGDYITSSMLSAAIGQIDISTLWSNLSDKSTLASLILTAANGVSTSTLANYYTSTQTDNAIDAKFTTENVAGYKSYVDALGAWAQISAGTTVTRTFNDDVNTCIANYSGLLLQTDLDSAVATIFAEGTGTGSYGNEKYYYCDSEGTTLSSPIYEVVGGETIVGGSFYSSSQLASKLLVYGTNTTVTASDLESSTPPFVVADGTDRYTIIAAKATEAALSSTKLRAAIEVGVKNDTSFINAIAQQVNVSTDELSIVNSTDNTKKVVVNGTGIKTLTKSGVTWNDVNAIKYDGSGFLGNVDSNGILWDTNGIVTINSHRDNSGGNQYYDYSDVFIGFKNIQNAAHNPYEIEVVESDNSTDVNTVNINPIDGLTVDRKYLSGVANSRYNAIYGADSISVYQEGAADNFSIKVPNGVGALDSIISFGTGSSSLRETDITSKLNVTGTIHTGGDISANGAISASNFSGKDDFLITNGNDPSVTNGTGASSTILKADTNPIVVYGKNKPVRMVGTTGTGDPSTGNTTGSVNASSVVSADGGTVSLTASTKVSASAQTIELSGQIKIYYNGSFYNLNLSALESAGYLTAA